MYLSRITIENFRCFGGGENRFELDLGPGLTALVGENDSGKTAVMDALRFAIGTTDQEWYRLQATDYNENAAAKELKITCTYDALSHEDKRAFVEYLTYKDAADGQPRLHVNWFAKESKEMVKGHIFRRVEVYSGKNGDGPKIAPEARELLRATYLRPLRDAEYALSAGRNSRLSNILFHRISRSKGGQEFDPKWDLDTINPALLKQLTVLGIGDLANALLEDQAEISVTRTEVDSNLKGLTLSGEKIGSQIKVSDKSETSERRLRHLLEKLDLSLGGAGKLGLGSNNLLFMATELLLLAQKEDGNKLLLIEEPEAHLHAQRQLRVMKFLQHQATESGIQIIVTTHSPNLASAIAINNLVMINGGHAFSLAETKTKLEASDYRFLERFLDVTKANLFFARGVLIVEGDSENILFPTLAKLIGRDLTEYGVSIVNVGGVGLRRFARIFQRAITEKTGLLNIPVACVTDLDIMPDCAPAIIGKLEMDDPWPAMNNMRRWRARRDFDTPENLSEHRAKIAAKASGQNVSTFVSDEWTLEYDLALGPRDQAGNFTGGLAMEVFTAASLAANDDAINANKKTIPDITRTSVREFEILRDSLEPTDDCAEDEVLASHVYSKFVKDGISKAIAAQYLAGCLQRKYSGTKHDADTFRQLLPKYILAAIDFASSDLGEDRLPPQDASTP